MEELFELRSFIEQGRYDDALALIGEMEEMSRDDKINKIESYLDVLILHLIKKHAEKRTTRSWETSIQNAADMIHRTNKRRKAGGYYLSREDLQNAIAESWRTALRRAALEAFEGRHDAAELEAMIDRQTIEVEALEIVAPSH